MEIYKPIVGTPAFMVSNFGNICSVVLQGGFKCLMI